MFLVDLLYFWYRTCVCAGDGGAGVDGAREPPGCTHTWPWLTYTHTVSHTFTHRRTYTHTHMLSLSHTHSCIHIFSRRALALAHPDRPGCPTSEKARALRPERRNVGCAGDGGAGVNGAREPPGGQRGPQDRPRELGARLWHPAGPEIRIPNPESRNSKSARLSQKPKTPNQLRDPFIIQHVCCNSFFDLNPQPHTPNPEPQSLNLEPETLKFNP